MRYDVIGGQGAGLVVQAWSDSAPRGNNPPGGQGAVYSIWGGWDQGLHLLLGTTTVPIPTNPNGFHVYQLKSSGGLMSATVDGVVVAGPKPVTVQPNTITIGSPIYAWWSNAPWDAIDVDYVQVTVP
jgi:hypothetical protein